MPVPFRPASLVEDATNDSLTVSFYLPDGSVRQHLFAREWYGDTSGRAAIVDWVGNVDAEIRRGPRAIAPSVPLTFSERLVHPPSRPPEVVRETDDECTARIVAYADSIHPGRPRVDPVQTAVDRMRAELERQVYMPVPATWSADTFAVDSSMWARTFLTADSLRGTNVANVIIDEAHTMPTPPTPHIPAPPPNEGLPPLVEPTHYLGMEVRRTTNVARGTITLQNNGANRGRLTIYIHPTTPVEVWQQEVRRQFARYLRQLQMSRPVTKHTCHMCGRAFPGKPGAQNLYCSDRCEAAAADYLTCGACGGTGAGARDGDKCGECYGTGFQPCAACAEDHARASLTFRNPANDIEYQVCPACVNHEREAGAIPL